MNKDKKKQIIGLFVIVVFFGSTFVFIAFDALLNQTASGNTNPGNTAIPDGFVSEGKLNENTIAQLYQNGYTIAEFHYYEGCCSEIVSSVIKLPAELEYQIVIQKIPDSELGSMPWFSAKSVYGEANYTLSSISNITQPLCSVLVKPPLECGLAALGNNS